MKAKISAILALAPLALFGCDENLTGKLSLGSPTVIVSPGGTKTTLPAGNYSTQIRPMNNGALAFISRGTGSVQMKVPLVSFEDGDVSIPARTLGQEFGLEGKIYTRSIPFDEIVPVYCVYGYRSDYVCHNRRRNRRIHRDCRWVEVEIPGEQDERRIGERNTRFLQLDLVRGRNSFGKFSGFKELGETIFRREIVSHCSRTGY